MKPWIVRINNFSAEEIPSVKTAGFRMHELHIRDTVGTFVAEKPQPFDGDVILRTDRLTETTYEMVFDFVSKHGGRVINDPTSNRLLSNFALHYPMIATFSPKAIILPSAMPPREILDQVRASNIRFPIFIKTEMKSLKSDSVLAEPTLDAVTILAAKLHAAFDPFATFVVKEMVKLDEAGQPPETLEYRSFVVDGEIVHREGGRRGMALPDPSANGATDFISRVVFALTQAGFPRHYIIDVAKIAGTGDFIVVEIKDAQFTKVRDHERYWQAMGEFFS